MIDLYAWATPNSVKVPILLEELGLAYSVKRVNVRQGEQKTPEFLNLNPNGKVPVIVDSDGPGHQPIVIVESAAILIYLAEKHGKFIPEDQIGRIRCLEWLFFHASSLGPSFGQSGYFQKLAPEKIPAAIERFHNEAIRTLKILDQRLAATKYLAGDYSIADIANFGWIWRREFAGIDFADTPHVARWYAALEQRPAIKNAIAALA
jgi:GSH-dependent disulfide-bond oxidoreductase